MSDRRLRILRVTGALLDGIFRAEPNGDALFRGTSSDAPKDLHVVGFHEHHMALDCFDFLVTSREFDPVPEGEEIPLVTPAYTSHYEGAAG